MRIIHKASFVFLLKDVYSKLPITTAVILCGGKQNPYTRKKDGHYVFSNLYPGTYEISITCKGYNSLNFSATLKENETKEMIFDLSYSAENQNITNLSRLDITCKRLKKPIANSDIKLKLKNELKFMKLLEKVETGGDKFKLNIDMNANLLGQKYIYEVNKKRYELFFWSFEQESGSYVLKDYAPEQIEPGGKFYAVWDLKTDNKGRLIMPLVTQFMKDNILNFELISGDAKAKLEVDVSGKHDTGDIFYLDANFRKISEQKV